MANIGSKSAHHELMSQAAGEEIIARNQLQQPYSTHMYDVKKEEITLGHTFKNMPLDRDGFKYMQRS
jgi:hypothetical protein